MPGLHVTCGILLMAHPVLGALARGLQSCYGCLLGPQADGDASSPADVCVSEHVCVSMQRHFVYLQPRKPCVVMLDALCCLLVACAGMEAVVANLLEPGDKIVVGVNGIWWVPCAVEKPPLVKASFAFCCQCVVGLSEPFVRQPVQQQYWYCHACATAKELCAQLVCIDTIAAL